MSPGSYADTRNDPSRVRQQPRGWALQAKVMILVMAPVSGNASAQEVRIPSPALCPMCSFAVDTVVALGDVDFRGPASTISRHPSGTFYVIVDATDDLIKVYRSDGRTLHPIGRRGGGPGEYEMVRNVLVDGDGLVHVLDGLLGRWSVFAPTGELVRSTPVRISAGLGMDAVLVADGMVVNVRQLGGGRTSTLVHLDQRGTLSPLPDVGASHWRQTWLQHRLLWAAGNGDLYVARPYGFVIDIYDRRFRRILSMSRMDDWSPRREPQEPPADGMFDTPQTPMLMGFWVDDQGLLWLQVLVPHRAWKPMPRVRAGDPRVHEALATLAARPRVETIIEVVDVKRRRVLARGRFNDGLGLPFGGGFFAQRVQDSRGAPGVLITRIHLRQETEGRSK